MVHAKAVLRPVRSSAHGCVWAGIKTWPSFRFFSVLCLTLRPMVKHVTLNWLDLNRREPHIMNLI